MGNDGGSIPTRRELVKNAARNPNTSELKAAQHEAQTHAWSYCPLSTRPLAAPIVSDATGTLFNKDAILEHLLPSPSSSPPPPSAAAVAHIRSLRDVVEVRFTSTPEGQKICPISSKELGPRARAAYLVPCGHAFAEAALREVAGDACSECGGAYAADDVIPILPLVGAEVERLRERARRLVEKGMTHSGKKAPGGKRKRKGGEGEKAVASATNGTENVKEKEEKEKTAVEDGAAGSKQSGIKNAATASLTTKVLEEQEERNKRRKLELNDNLKTLFSKSGYNAQAQKGGDFMTRGFSLPKRA